MERQLSDRLKIIELGNNATLQYQHPDGTLKYLAFDNSGISISTNAILTTAMPVAYSSGFQTATLASTFMQPSQIAFANIAGFSITSTVNGVSTTYALKTA